MTKKNRKHHSGSNRRSGAAKSGQQRQNGRRPAQPRAAVIREASGALGSMARELQEPVASVGETIASKLKSNPLPIALVGFGITCAGAGISWLLMKQPTGPRVGVGAEEPVGTLMAARENVGRVADGAGQLAKRALSAIGGSAQLAGDEITRLVHDARLQGGRLGSSTESGFVAHPLAVGAAVLAAGTLIGLAAPSTLREARWLGRRRDQVIDRASGLVRGAIDKVETIARQTIGENSVHIA